MSRFITGCGSTQYGCCADGVTYSNDKDGSNCPTPAPPVLKREYDQILSGDVKITKVSNGYKIVFSKKNISKVLVYQTWSSTSAPLNNSRKVVEVKAKDWVKIFRTTRTVPFTPTTVMELRDGKGKYKKHVFVINDANVNKHGEVVFRVSSNDINSNSNSTTKQLKKIPTGEFHNARFDVDADGDRCGQSGFPYLSDKITDWTNFFSSITKNANTLNLVGKILPPGSNGFSLYIYILPGNTTIQDITYSRISDPICMMIPYVDSISVEGTNTSVNKDGIVQNLKYDNLSGMTVYINLRYPSNDFYGACYFNFA